MEEKKLYPMKFCALQDDYSWGSETFRLADLGYRDSLIREGWLAGNAISEIMDMYVDRVVGERVFESWGRQFPICVKSIKVNGKMPLRVHPGDEEAQQRWDFLGKEKLWYILRCGKDARVMAGFRKDTDASEVCGKCSDGSVDEILNIIAPHAGQVLHIAPGTPHCAWGDLEILEVSESSPLDFCMCGWGEEVSEVEFDPALDFIDVLDLIDYSRFKAGKAEGRKLVSLDQFEVGKLPLTDPLHIYNDKIDTFWIYSCIAGDACIQINVLGQKASFPLKSGETMLIPADCQDFFLVPTERDTVLLEISVPDRPAKDSYLDRPEQGQNKVG